MIIAKVIINGCTNIITWMSTTLVVKSGTDALKGRSKDPPPHNFVAP